MNEVTSILWWWYLRFQVTVRGNADFAAQKASGFLSDAWLGKRQYAQNARKAEDAMIGAAVRNMKSPDLKTAEAGSFFLVAAFLKQLNDQRTEMPKLRAWTSVFRGLRLIPAPDSSV